MQRSSPYLALGVMTAPGYVRNRENVRALSHSDPTLARVVYAVFVLGDLPCARDPTAEEARRHQDIVYVNSSDCTNWHRAPKVQAWFELAVVRWPAANWYGKSEDDGLLRIPALLLDLWSLPSNEYVIYGIMAWTGACTAFVDNCPMDGTPGSGYARSTASWENCTAGATCFGGALQPMPHEVSRCLTRHQQRCQGAAEECRGMPHLCHVPSCTVAGKCSRADTLMAPYALGPVDVRSPRLARAVAECDEAKRYMAAISARAARPGATMDGGQALPVAMCVPRVLIADATWRRMSFTASAVRNSRGRNTTVLGWSHPAKRMASASARHVWDALVSPQYVPAPLPTYMYAATNCTLASSRCAHAGPVSLTYRSAITPPLVLDPSLLIPGSHRRRVL